MLFKVTSEALRVQSYQLLFTRRSRDIHSFEITSLYHGNGQSARSG